MPSAHPRPHRGNPAAKDMRNFLHPNSRTFISSLHSKPSVNVSVAQIYAWKIGASIFFIIKTNSYWTLFLAIKVSQQSWA